MNENNPATDREDHRIRQVISEYRDNLFCRWAVILEITTAKKVGEALALFQRREREGTATSLSQFFNAIGLDKGQMSLLLAVKAYMKQLEEDKKFGNIAINNGYVTKAVVKTTLAIQMADFKRDKTSTKLGDMLVENGEMTEEQRDLVLVVQKRKDPTIQRVVKDVRKNEAKVEERLNMLLELSLSADRMSAWITAKGKIPGEISPSQVLSWLYRKKVKFGIYNAAIEEMVGQNTFGERHKVAEGQYPVPGKDAAVVYHFDTEFTAEAGWATQGKTRGTGAGAAIPSVKAGFLLAQKRAAEPGKPGITVLGKQVEPAPVSDIHLWTGNGVHSPDRLRFYAEIAGLPGLSKNRTITVEPRYQVFGDVDCQMGSIFFDNDVHITGTIRKGVKIRCHNLKAREILAAQIETTGNVEVTRGIIGATIMAVGDGRFVPAAAEGEGTGSINAKFIRDSQIKAYGDVRAEKEIAGSSIVTSGRCKVRSSGYTIEGRIAASQISAMNGIICVDIGHPGAEGCMLSVGVDVNLKEKLEKAEGDLTVSLALREQLEVNAENFRGEMEKTVAEMDLISESLDVTRVEQETLEKRIAAYLEDGDKETAAHAELALTELVSKGEASAEALAALRDKRAIHNARVEKVNRQIERVKRDIGRLNEKINMASAPHEGAAVVEAGGVICESTVIRGVHSEMTLEKNLRKVRIEEMNISGGGWEMRVVG